MLKMKGFLHYRSWQCFRVLFSCFANSLGGPGRLGLTAMKSTAQWSNIFMHIIIDFPRARILKEAIYLKHFQHHFSKMSILYFLTILFLQYFMACTCQTSVLIIFEFSTPLIHKCTHPLFAVILKTNKVN